MTVFALGHAGSDASDLLLVLVLVLLLLLLLLLLRLFLLPLLFIRIASCSSARVFRRVADTRNKWSGRDRGLTGNRVA